MGASNRHPKLVSGPIVFSLALLALPLAAEPAVPNPDVHCWMGEKAASTTADDDFVFWGTDGETGPYLITHDREQMREGEELTQLNYNFLTYWFGDESAPIQARHYLNTHEVSVLLPSLEDRSLTLEDARQKVPVHVLCYLQKRFPKVTILTDQGYEALWELGGADDHR